MLSIPEPLLQSLSNIQDINQVAFKNAILQQAPVCSVRLNPSKIKRKDNLPLIQENLEQELKEVFPDTAITPVPWATAGYYLGHRPSFIADPLFHAGLYYVQEASSMFLEHALRTLLSPNEAVKVLDLCAAPGGKSTLIRSALNEKSILVANEVIKGRVPVLLENLIKWGSSNTLVTHNDPRQLARLENYFDMVVVDAPCSGSGLFRKQPAFMQEWSPDLVTHCALRQERILTDIWPALKVGGILIYSTCSYSPEENEDITDFLCAECGAETLSLPLHPEWGIVESRSGKTGAFGYRFYPHQLKGEGFFLACFRKRETEASQYKKLKAIEVARATKKEMERLAPWLNSEAMKNGSIIKHEETFYWLNELLKEEIGKIMTAECYIRKAGTELGSIKGKDFVPAHAFALSGAVSQEIPVLELERSEALRYLRKEEVQLKNNRKPGFHIVTFNGYNLGWVKVLPGRVNNYFPKDWRILKNMEDLED